MIPNVPRKAYVTQTDGQGRIGTAFADSKVGGPPVPRPFVGGFSGSTPSGLFTSPPIGSQVLVLYEKDNYPAATVSATDVPGQMPSLNPGETAIYGPDGRVISYLKSDGTTTMWSKPGQPSTTVDATGNWAIGGSAQVHGAIPSESPGGVSVYLGQISGTARIILPAGASTSHEIDNSGGVLRFFRPGTVDMQIDASGNVTVNGTLNGVAISHGPASLDANSHVQQQAVYDPTEAATNDTLGSTSTIVNNLNRLRYQVGQLVGGAWTAAVQMLPLSQKAAASGVASLDANSHVIQALAKGVRQVVVADNTANQSLASTTWSGLSTDIQPSITVQQSSNLLFVLTGTSASNDATNGRKILFALRIPGSTGGTPGPIPSVDFGSFFCAASSGSEAHATIAGMGTATPTQLSGWGVSYSGGQATIPIQLLYQVEGSTWTVSTSTSPTFERLTLLIVEYA